MGQQEPNNVIRRSSWRLRLVHDEALSQDLADRLFRDPDEVVRSGLILKPGARCTVVRVTDGDRELVLKRYNMRGPVHTALHWFLRSRARWSWLNGRRLRRAGLDSPRPLALVEQGPWPLKNRSYVLMDCVQGRTLLDVFRDEPECTKRLTCLADVVGHIWQTMGERRIGHGDMKATNFIVDDADRVWLVDLDGMRPYPAWRLYRRRRGRDRARFMRNWKGLPKVEAAFDAALGTD